MLLPVRPSSTKERERREGEEFESYGGACELEKKMVEPAAKKACSASVRAVKRIAIEGNIGK